ncbi:PHP domain-containing protein [bacterium]|nr:PHP domain-containing protein [bacterium]
MKITAINTYDINFMQKRKKQAVNKNHTYKKQVIGALGVCFIGIGSIILYNKTNILNQKIMTENDKKFFNNILKSLKKNNIDAKIEDLKSIVAPDEFKKLIKKYKPEQFQVGMQISEAKAQNIPLEEFYKNAIDGNFRISLHTHSNFSDGNATVEEFLESARKYADKVAKLNKNDGLPPFTIALTDHDCIKGCQEIIKIIAQNPEKYKNLKFVSGCEFSVQNGLIHHDITGLALNPFDETLLKVLEDLANNRINTICEFLDKQPEFDGKKIKYNDLVKYEKEYNASHNKSKRCVENGSGIVAIRHAIKFYYKMTQQDVNHSIMNKLGDKDILSIKKVIKSIKNNGGYASLTHPVKSFWEYIGDDFLTNLKILGIDGIEVNHQYTPSKITKLGKNNNNISNADNLFKEITSQYKNFAEKNGLFLSGGTDSHKKQIFSRQPEITKEILEKIYN